MSALAEYHKNESSSLNLVELEAAEDGDSRDSGISMTSCSSDEPDITTNTNQKENKMGVRHPLVDCTNIVSKGIFNSSSSRNSSYFHNDTPTGRKKKSIISPELDKDQSRYEQYHNKVMKSRSVSLEIEEKCLGGITRKRTSSSSSTFVINTTLNRKRSKQMMVADLYDNPFANDEDDEVFSSADSSTSRPIPHSQSLWDISAASNARNKRGASNESLNGSVISRGPVKTYRAMSTGFLEPDSALPPCLEVKYSLPAVENPQKESQAYRSVSPMTLFGEFQRLGNYFNSVYIVIDCRYPFEYNGGHIKGAINVYKKSDIELIFFPESAEGEQCLVKKRIPIFYCEFSQKRGPTMANTLRSIDRVRNELNYPHVEYPEIYLLDHGYRSLWRLEECRVICEPRNYVPMDKPEFSKELKSFRGARLRSNASVKSNSEMSLNVTRKISMRRNSTILKMNSKFSSNSALTNSFSELDDVFFRSDSKIRKSVSAFDISSIESEGDIDSQLQSIGCSTEGNEENADISQLENVRNDDVKTSLKFKTPDLPTPFQILMQEETEVMPRVKLDFSSISDTE